jgi:hypothetical protein
MEEKESRRKAGLLYFKATGLHTYRQDCLKV